MITTADDEAGLEAEVGRDPAERGFERRLVEGGLDRGHDDLVLVGEDPEDRALGDPGRLGDLAGGQPVAELGQQRDRRGDDRRAPLLGGQRRGAPRLRRRCRTGLLVGVAGDAMEWAA